jgi:hypothetical protein
MKHSLSIGLLAVVATACGDESSSSLLTSGMSADMTAQDNGDGSTAVSAELFAGDPLQLIYVDLGPDDQLVAKHGSESQVMQQEQLLTIIAYTTTFTDAQDGDSFTVSLQRSVDAGAPNSTMTLPTSFDLDPVPDTWSRGSAVSLSWSPTSDAAMTWQVEGPCIETLTGGASNDEGSATIPAGQIVLAQGETETSCSATLTVTRSEDGTIDPAFGHGGDAEGEQVRTATFTTTP